MVIAQFDKNEVLKILAEAGKICPKKMPVYLVGGGAMAIRGEKDVTKDVDLILEHEEDAEGLGGALVSLGFEVNIQPPMECESLVDAKIMTALIGMRVDIFVRTVCHKLVFSPGMKERSEFYGNYGNISLSICSREDIFLLKSVTERGRDLDDMIVLFRKGMDKDALLTECQIQGQYDELLDGRIWEAFLLRKIDEMEEKYGVSIPWKRELRRIAETKLGSKLVLEQIKGGLNTVNRISERLGLRPNDVRQYISQLESKGMIKIDRTIRPNTIAMNNTAGQ